MYQLGDGTTDNSNVPTLVSTSEKFTTIVAGTGDHTCGLRQDGTAFCWGGLCVAGSTLSVAGSGL